MNKQLVLLALAVFVQFSTANAKGVEKLGDYMKTLGFAKESGLFGAMLAKELCSCLFVQGVADEFGADRGKDVCIDRSNIPMRWLLLDDMEINVVADGQSKQVTVTQVKFRRTGGPRSEKVERYNRKRFQGWLEENTSFGCNMKEIAPN